MKIHYFQRYHKGEDVATANTMLLLQRLYSYSSDKFFRFLKNLCFSDIEFEPELSFRLQEKHKESTPDATITQPSFKIVVETKLTDWFYKDQLIRHLSTFSNEEYKVLITLSSAFMEQKKKEKVDKAIEDYCSKNRIHIVHVNTTFEQIAQGIQEAIVEHDYEMKEVLDDFLDYCRNDKLITASDSWKIMRMQLAGATLDYNMASGVYYDSIERGFRPHDYLSLYKQKSVRAVGKIVAIITAVAEEDGLHYEVEKGELTEERKRIIDEAREDGKKYGYTLMSERYFFVEKFYETDYKKVTKGSAMGSRIFDLTEVLQINDGNMPETEKIAELLRYRTWN